MTQPLRIKVGAYFLSNSLHSNARKYTTSLPMIKVVYPEQLLSYIIQNHCMVLFPTICADFNITTYAFSYHLKFLHTSYKHHILRDSTAYYTTSHHSHLLQYISTAIFTEKRMIGISYQ